MIFCLSVFVVLFVRVIEIVREDSVVGIFLFMCMWSR